MTRRRWLIIPDPQVRQGVDTRHIDWCAQAIVEYKPDVIIHLGDHWDFPSLSTHDAPGSKEAEGRRVKDDIDAGNEAFERLVAPMNSERLRISLNRKRQWNPECHFFFGNHEDRLTRAIFREPKWEGMLTLDALNTQGFERHDFLKIVEIDGIKVSHFFANTHSGKPIGGSIENRLNKIGGSFVQGHEQGLLYGIKQYPGELRRHGLVCGSCLTPNHLVLTADLRYIPLGDVKAGDTLVSFDENISDSPGRSRAYKTGTVLAVKTESDTVYRVGLESGKEFRATADHFWLTRVGGPSGVREGSTYKWRTTDSLKVGTRIPRPLGEWETMTSNDAGWLAGFYDGEGCYYNRKTCRGYVGQLTAAQKPGVVLDKAIRLLHDVVGVDGLTCTNQHGVGNIRLRGGSQAIAKMLGSIRPVRLLPKFTPELLGTMQSVTNDRVIYIEKVCGREDVVRIDIDAKTMIVEGYPHHNCYQHNEAYRGAQGTGEWRGIVILNRVQDGDYDVMPLRMSYLEEKYAFGVSRNDR